MPECSVVIGQCVAYLALAPKSTAITKGDFTSNLPLVVSYGLILTGCL